MNVLSENLFLTKIAIQHLIIIVVIYQFYNGIFVIPFIIMLMVLQYKDVSLKRNLV